MMKTARQEPFLIAFSYLLAFLFIRIAVQVAGSAESEFAQAAKIGELPGVRFYIGRNIILFGYHIHHFYFGIFLICLAGWLAIVGNRFFSSKILAVIYGAGLGLFLDEIGLLLTWGDYYSSLTYTVSLCVAGLFLNIIFFSSFWGSFKNHLFSHRPGNSIEELLLKNKGLLRAIDLVSTATGKTTKVTHLFAGAVYLFVTLMILFYPHSLRYWIGGTFIVHGLSILVRVFYKNEGKYEKI